MKKMLAMLIFLSCTQTSPWAFYDNEDSECESVLMAHSQNNRNKGRFYTPPSSYTIQTNDTLYHVDTVGDHTTVRSFNGSSSGHWDALGNYHVSHY